MLTHKIKLRIFFWIILTLVIFWLLYYGLAPIGKITYVKKIGQDNYFIGKLTPEERVRFVKNKSQKIIGDPAYFTLHALRPFDKAKITVTYKNNLNKIIEAGVLADKQVWRYDLKPLENNILDEYLAKWPSVREENSVLLQRQPEAVSFTPLKYKSIENFLNNLPDANEIALYNYNLKREFTIENYLPQKNDQDLGISLRGNYQFYIYIKNEDPYLAFTFSDLNKNKDSDPIDINIYQLDKMISNFHLEDNALPADNGRLEQRGEMVINPSNLLAGVYKIEVKANDDIITDQIITKQQKLVFINRLWIADNSREPLSLVTDSNIINAQTINPGKLQTIKINNDNLNITDTYRQFSLETKKGINEIKFFKNDTIISGEGFFAINDKYYFNPQIKKISQNFNNQNIKYIIANYNPAQEKNDWHIASAEFDLRNAYKEKEDSFLPRLNLLSKKFSFLISVPGLKADDQIDDWVDIKEIKIELEGSSIFKKLENIYTTKNEKNVQE